MAFLLSFTNLVAAAILSVSTEDANYPKANAAQPQRPFLPWKATVATDSWLVVDFGSAKILDLVGLVHCNFTAVRIQGHASDSWGSPSYNQLLTVTRNPWNRRYQHCHLSTGFNFRYLRIFIPTQTPTSGAVFSLGGVWAGLSTAVPTNWQWDYRMRTIEPKQEVGPAHGGWAQQLILGEPVTRIEAQLEAELAYASPAEGDQLESWLEIFRQAHDAGVFFFYLNLNDVAQAWVLQSLQDPDWAIRRGFSTSPWSLREVVGP